MKTTEEFSYLTSNGKTDRKAMQQRFTQMHLDEIRRRTQLLAELHYDKRYIKKRIKQNIRWEFETLGLPEFYNQVDKLIDQYYRPPAENRSAGLKPQTAAFPEDPTCTK